LIDFSDEIRLLVKEVHPHFNSNKYLGFIVLTQTCDLVRRRRKPPKAEYICLSVVRPIMQVRNKLLSAECGKSLKSILPKTKKGTCKELLQRIINQNEEKLGLFYLHEDPNLPWESGVAYLRVSISFKSEHYDKILNSRIGRLSREFQSRLGWMAGNLYSRPAVRDWTESDVDKSTEKLLLDKLIGTNQHPDDPIWFEDSILDKALQDTEIQELVKTENSPSCISGIIQQKFPLTEKYEEVTKIITDLLRSVLNSKLRNATEDPKSLVLDDEMAEDINDKFQKKLSNSRFKHFVSS